MSWWRLSRRALGAQRGAVALVVVVVTVLALAVTVLPRFVAASQADQVRHRLSDVSPQLRDLVATPGPGAFDVLASGVSGLPVTPEENLAGWDAVTAGLAAVTEDVPPPLRDVIGAPGVTAELEAVSIPVNPAIDVRRPSLTLSGDPGVADRVEIVDGAAPAPVRWDPDTAVSTGGLLPVEQQPDLEVEVMLEESSAQRLALAVGDRVSVANLVYDVTVVLAGTYRVRDAEDPAWAHVPTGAGPSVLEDLNLGTAVNARAYVAPDGWFATVAALGQLSEWSLFYPVDVDAIREGDPRVMASQLRGLTAQIVEVPAPPGSDLPASLLPRMRLSTELAARVDAVAGENAAAANIVALVAVGPLGVAVAVLALLTQLLIDRRRPALAMLRARGAAPSRLRTVLGLEALAIALPAAALGWGVATAVLGGVLGPPERWSPLQWAPAAALALVPAAVAVTSRLPTGLRTRRRDLAVGGVVRDVVVLAAAGLALSQVLGVAPGAIADTGDPLLVAAPLLAALAVTVLVLRLYPVAARAAHAALRGGRHLSAFLGSARAVRDPGATLTSVLAVVVGVSVTVFSVVTLATVRDGVERAVWVSSGSDLRVSGPRVDADQLEAVRALDGVAAAATVAAVSPAILTTPTASQRTTLYLVDPAAYAAVTADVPGSVGAAPVADLADGAAVADAASDAASPAALPLLVSPRLDVAPGTDGVRVSTGESVEARVLTSGDVLPGVAGASDTWLLAAAAALPEVAASTPARLLLVRLVPGADGDAVATQVEEITGPAGVENAAAARAAATATPVLRLLEGSLAGSVAAAALLAVGALVAVQVAAAPRRARALATLRLLGLRRRGLRALAWWDLTPWVALSALAALGLGALTSRLLLRTLDLRSFTGSEQPLPVWPGVSLLLVLGGVALAVVGCSLLPTLLSSRRAATPARATTAEEDS
ncbi:FtsX-like permease family protein [Litorihabitans aurantiacus]|uniref:ABC3 transporter permease C-terminal domain-containing protein n=1 Tax=Litorihabitans aurantiacus TaxID=1930061 RepID=A0AA37UM30_9MICO|nr:FtsX-like permease family protein [Litorihabitans aurantiacus]GMA30574.1 hypothetical protein GCM10025875_05660 [Litorihabitans aurantiacus]